MSDCAYGQTKETDLAVAWLGSYAAAFATLAVLPLLGAGFA